MVTIKQLDAKLTRIDRKMKKDFDLCRDKCNERRDKAYEEIEKVRKEMLRLYKK